MPVVYYLIPMVEGPYSFENPQRPQYIGTPRGGVADIQVQWQGCNVDAFGAYICQVNTTTAKHTDLSSRAGVRQLPNGVTWNTVISTLSNQQRNFISNLCNQLGIPYDPTETIGELINRIIFAADLSLGSTPVSTTFAGLSQTQKDKLVAFCSKWGRQTPGNNETIKNMVSRLAKDRWNGDLPIAEF